jgi:hypothetical protein
MQPIGKYYQVSAALSEQQFEKISHVMDDEATKATILSLRTS